MHNTMQYEERQYVRDLLDEYIGLRLESGDYIIVPSYRP